MKRDSRTWKGLCGLAVVALIAVACGGETDGSGDDTPDDAPADAEDAENDSSDASETDSEDDSGEAEDDAENAFYEGKTIELIVPYGTGGGTDLLGRYIAENLSEYVPGNPTIQVVNVTGGSGIVGANQFDREGAPEGETLLLTSSTVTINALFGDELVEYDFREWNPIAGFPGTGAYWVTPGLGFDPDDLSTVTDLSAQSGVAGFLSAGGSVVYLLDKLGVDLDVISGFDGTGAVNIAWEQGELDIGGTSAGAYLDTYASVVESGEADRLLAPGFVQGGELVRDPQVPDFPTGQELWEAVYGDTDAEEWAIYRQIHALTYGLQKGLFLPADAPPEAVEALRQGMVDWMGEPGAPEELLELTGIFAPVIGDEAVEAFQLLDMNDAAIDSWREVLAKHGFEG